MIDFIVGIVFVILFISFLALLGKNVHNSLRYSENLLYGFVIYTSLQFIGGFVTQLFRLEWIYYQIYMISLLVVLVVFCLIKSAKKFEIKIILRHFKKYGMIYVIALFFVLVACLNIQYLWNANNIDDGYYLNKIAMAPYVGNFVDYNYAVGVAAPETIMRIVNTFEIEAAFFAQILGIDASVFAKVFLAFINYTLVLHAIYWLYSEVVSANEQIKSFYLVLIPILFFGIYQELLSNFGILFFQDSWQFNTAMWYGSTLVRSLGLILLITPLLKNHWKITKKYIIFFILCSISMFSKASQALPMIIIFTLCISIIKVLAFLKKRKGLKYSLMIVVALIIILLLIPVSSAMQSRADVIADLVSKNMGTIVIKLSIFLIAVSYLLENKMLKSWNNILIMFGALILIPGLNKVFILGSIYDFVAARTVTMYLFTLVVTAILIAFLIIRKVVDSQRKLVLIYAFVAVGFASIPFISVQRNLGIVDSFKVLSNNPTLMPASTIELGTGLSELAQLEKVKLRVVSPAWVGIDNTPHALASSLRYNNYDIISISAIPRYNTVYPNNAMRSYTEKKQELYEFYHTGVEKDVVGLGDMLKQYQVNCIISYYDKTAESLVKDFGYRIVKTVKINNSENQYSILYKEMS